MGCIGSKGPKQNFDKIHEDNEEKDRFLILGCGYAGKSTLFKHMTKMKGEDYETYRPVLEHNHKELLEALELVQASEVAESIGQDDSSSSSSSSGSGSSGSSDSEAKDAQNFKSERLRVLWERHGRKNKVTTWERHGMNNKVGRFASAPTLISCANELASTDCLISRQHALAARARTKGLVEGACTLPESFGLITASVYDVGTLGGGPRGDRRKLLHCFYGLPLVLYVANLASYCCSLPEDEGMNELMEQINVWQELAASSSYVQRDTRFLLVLNHFDRFSRLQPIEPFDPAVFPGAPAPGAVWGGVNFVREKFLDAFPSDRPDPFVVVTSLLDEKPTYFHLGVVDQKHNACVRDALEPALPAILQDSVIEYAPVDSTSLLNPQLIELLNTPLRRDPPQDNCSTRDLGIHCCLQHTYAPEDRVR